MKKIPAPIPWRLTKYEPPDRPSKSTCHHVDEWNWSSVIMIVMYLFTLRDTVSKQIFFIYLFFPVENRFFMLDPEMVRSTTCATISDFHYAQSTTLTRYICNWSSVIMIVMYLFTLRDTISRQIFLNLFLLSVSWMLSSPRSFYHIKQGMRF